MSSEVRRVALIVACDRYSDPELKQLQAPPKDAEALQGIFENPKIGGFKVASLINQPYWIVKEKIDEFIQSCSKEDTLLLYFSCHGIKDRNGLLYFATENTNSKRLYSTGIEASFVNRMLDHCRARQKVVLLDCCYSGAIEKGRVHRGADKQINVSEYLGKGSVIITASDSMQYALEDDEIKSLRTGSFFTSALVEGLENGKADVNNDGKITYSELYDYVYNYVRSITPNQTPTLITHEVQGDFVIFKNIQDSAVSGDSKPQHPVMHDPILQFIEEASMYLEQEQYDKAIKIFDGILMLRSGHIEALNGKGVALCNQEKYQEALECFNEVLKIKPRHPHASTYVKIIKDRISKGYNTETNASSKDSTQDTTTLEKRTEEKVKKALSDSTQTPSELIKKGDQFYEQAKYQEAILCYDQALKIEPHSELAWKNKGNALDAKGDYEGALICFKETLKINPNSQIYRDKIRVELEKLGQSYVSETVPAADPRNPYNDPTLPYHNPNLDKKNNESNQAIQKPLRRSDNSKPIERPFSGVSLNSVNTSEGKKVTPSKLTTDANLSLSDFIWNDLLRALERKECIPIIGEGASSPWIPSRRDIAYKWAKEHGYPFEDLSQLSKIAQFLAIQNGDELYPKVILSNELRGIKPPDFLLEESRDIPYAVLADLNLPLYITTNYDYFMEEALISRGRNPVSEFCRWDENLDNYAKAAGYPSVFEIQERNETMSEFRYAPTSRPYRPTESKPLVYHLYGIIDIPRSMVLTEKDYEYFTLMVNRVGNQSVLPLQIRVALAKSSLFLFGYSLDDRDFRTLSQGIINPYSASTKGLGKNLAVMSPPSVSEGVDARQQHYLDAYAKNTLNLRVYWRNASEFSKELRKRLDDFGRLQSLKQ